MEILLDTSFLLLPFERNVDIFEELKYSFGNPELFTLSACVEELKNKNPAAAELMEKKGVQVIASKGNADNLLLRNAHERDMALATVDRKLRGRAKKKGIKVIFFKSKRNFVIE